jgi:hypothetical protein
MHSTVIHFRAEVIRAEHMEAFPSKQSHEKANIHSRMDKDSFSMRQSLGAGVVYSLIQKHEEF